MILAAPARAQATRTLVSGIGDDANPCNHTAPCKTFAGAISKTSPGGQVISAGANDAVRPAGLDIDGLGTGLSGIKLLSGGALEIKDCRDGADGVARWVVSQSSPVAMRITLTVWLPIAPGSTFKQLARGTASAHQLHRAGLQTAIKLPP
jgi:hypothetical protein